MIDHEHQHNERIEVLLAMSTTSAFAEYFHSQPSIIQQFILAMKRQLLFVSDALPFTDIEIRSTIVVEGILSILINIYVHNKNATRTLFESQDGIMLKFLYALLCYPVMSSFIEPAANLLSKLCASIGWFPGFFPTRINIINRRNSSKSSSGSFGSIYCEKGP